MSNLLVTGGAGFIGSAFVLHHLAVKPDDEVTVLDALTYAGTLQSLTEVSSNPHYHFVRGDICDSILVQELLRKQQIDTIVHFAAETHVDRSIDKPDSFVRTNVHGTCSLLDAARALWVKPDGCHGHFHHVSTDEVFGSLAPDDPAFTEENPLRPNSPYSASKASSDMFVRAYGHTYGLEVSTTNCSNNYGPRQFPEKLIPLTITRLLTGGRVPVYGDGKQIRDWLYVEDHCRAIELVLDKKATGSYNIGGHAEITNREIIDTVCSIIDRRFAENPGLKEQFPDAAPCQGVSCQEMLFPVDDRPGSDRRYAMNFEKARRELGYVPAFDVKQGLVNTVDWYLGHVTWWRPLLANVKDLYDDSGKRRNA